MPTHVSATVSAVSRSDLLIIRGVGSVISFSFAFDLRIIAFVRLAASGLQGRYLPCSRFGMGVQVTPMLFPLWESLFATGTYSCTKLCPEPRYLTSALPLRLGTYSCCYVYRLNTACFRS
jgi:hypothetical protein